MGMEADLRARLLADSGVEATGCTGVSWGGRNREDGLPSLVLLMVSPGRDYYHGGATGEDEPRIQIDTYGATDEEADALSKAVRACLEQAATFGDTKFEEGFLDGEQWIDEGEQDGGATLFRISQDYIFLHSPA